MAKSRAERKKDFIRIGALVIAGIMVLSVILALVINH